MTDRSLSPWPTVLTGTTQEPRPTLCGDCDQRHETDWEQTWPGATRQEPEQEQAVPEQKTTGWLSRLRR
ncbi:hypothetical protein AB0K93_26600 [Streptomyces sp. NPDC052676]|uniref:hypothetical protein n=1 Tax=Streptomyces sp. NPDC052676 TaxID=3154953 RepID=UPI00343572B3